MKLYTVVYDESRSVEFTSLSAAKKEMKAHNARGYITKVFSNGDFVDCGEITLKGSNKTFTANTRQTKAGY